MPLCVLGIGFVDVDDFCVRLSIFAAKWGVRWRRGRQSATVDIEFVLVLFLCVCVFISSFHSLLFVCCEYVFKLLFATCMRFWNVCTVLEQFPIEIEKYLMSTYSSDQECLNDNQQIKQIYTPR